MQLCIICTLRAEKMASTTLNRICSVTNDSSLNCTVFTINFLFILFLISAVLRYCVINMPACVPFICLHYCRFRGGGGLGVGFCFIFCRTRARKRSETKMKQKKLKLKKLNVAFVKCGRALNCIKEIFCVLTSRRRSVHKAKCIV